MRAIARVYRQAFGAAKGKTANVSVGGRAKMLPPRTLATLALIAIVAHAPSGAAQGTTSADEGWREFSGSMNLTGHRHVIAMGSAWRAGIVELSGTVLLSGPQRPGTALGTEQLRLDHGRGRCTVDLDEGFVATRGGVVDGSGDQRLSGPALAAEEDRDLRIRNPADDVGDRPEGGTASRAGPRPV